MQPHPLRCICALLVIAAVSGCQSIPERPLDLRATYDELEQRDLAVRSIRDYAASLVAARHGADAAFDAADGLSLAEAEAVALWYNAELRVARLEVERAGALADVAGRWADPELGLDAGRKWFDGDLDPSWIGGASLSVTIPISGRIRAERRARTAEHETAMLLAAESEWRVLLGLRAAWIRWSEVVEGIRLLDEHLTLLGPFADAARELVQAGELDPGTARLFLIERGRKQAMWDAVVFEEIQTRGKLMQLLGLLPDAPVTLVPELSGETIAVFESRTAEQLATSHPTMVRLNAEYAAAEARLRVELRKQYPDITLSPEFTEERDETSVTLGFGLPIPVWNANRAGIADAFAQREIARARVESAMLGVLAEIAQAEAELRGSRARRERLAAEVAPEVDRQIEESRILLRSGELDMPSLFQVLTQTYDVKQELLAALADEQSSEALVAALTNPIALTVKEERPAE